MQANLGDGLGWTDQKSEFRELYDESPIIGACLETFKGGNHFRFWQQDGTKAWFLAVSQEENLLEHHTIDVSARLRNYSSVLCSG